MGPSPPMMPSVFMVFLLRGPRPGRAGRGRWELVPQALVSKIALVLLEVVELVLLVVNPPLQGLVPLVVVRVAHLPGLDQGLGLGLGRSRS